MRRRTPLFSALDLNQLASGLQPDLHPLHRVLWEEGENVVFAAGKVKRRKPSTLLFPTDNLPIRGLAQQQVNSGERRVWYAFVDASQTTTQIRYWNGIGHEVLGQAPVQLNETSLAPASFVDFTPYGDWMIANAPHTVSRQSVLYKPNAYGLYANAPVEPVRFMKKLSFVLAIAPKANPKQVAWSDSSDIEAWAPTKENTAGSLTIEELDTPIRAAEHLGNNIAVYSEDQLALVTYLGAPFFFTSKVALNGIGAVGKMAVCSDGRANYGVSRNGVWWTDGISMAWIDEGMIHDYFQDNVNWGQKSKIVAARDDISGCIEFSFPMGLSSEPNEAWSFDPRSKGWSKVPAFTVKDERKLLSRPIYGTSGGLVLLDQAGESANNPLVLRTKPLMMQAEGAGPHQAYRIDEVVLLLQEELDVQFRVLCSHTVDGPWAASAWQGCYGGASTYDIYDLEDGVYFKLEFRSVSPAWQLNLQGFMLFGTVEGTKRD